MSHVAISDLHIGRDDKADDFYSDLSLQYLCSEVNENNDTLILNGDICEGHQASADEIYAAHRPTIEAMKGVTDLYVIDGNHDNGVTAELLDMEPLPWLVLDGVYYEHGHAHDPLVRRWPALCRLATWTCGWLERWIHKDIDAWLGGTGRYGGQRAESIARYHMAVGRAAREHGCERALYGHLHWKYPMQVMPPLGFAEWIGPEVGNMGHCTNGNVDVTRLEV